MLSVAGPPHRITSDDGTCRDKLVRAVSLHYYRSDSEADSPYSFGCQAEAMLGDKDKRDEIDAVMRHARVQVLKP